MRRRHGILGAAAVLVASSACGHHSAPAKPTSHVAPAKHRKHLSVRDALPIRVSPRPVSRSEPERKPLPEPTRVVTPAVSVVPATAAFNAWLSSPMSRQVRDCESNFDYGMVENNYGTWYFGAWSANADFVLTYAHVDPWDFVSGGRFTLSRAMQDRMAYRGWQARGWEPWACAS